MHYVVVESILARSLWWSWPSGAFIRSKAFTGFNIMEPVHSERGQTSAMITVTLGHSMQVVLKLWGQAHLGRWFWVCFHSEAISIVMLVLGPGCGCNSLAKVALAIKWQSTVCLNAHAWTKTCQNLPFSACRLLAWRFLLLFNVAIESEKVKGVKIAR